MLHYSRDFFAPFDVSYDAGLLHFISRTVILSVDGHLQTVGSTMPLYTIPLMPIRGKPNVIYM